MSRTISGISVFGSATAIAIGIFAPAWAQETTELVSLRSGGVQGDLWSYYPAMSSDGRFIAFWSHATNLVPGDTNGNPDVFVRDRQMGTTQPLNVTSVESRARWEDPLSISTDGAVRRLRLPTWCRATLTTPATCLSATARRARLGV